MSQVSQQLGLRTYAPCARTGHHFSLAELLLGATGRVCGVWDELRPDAARRLVDLGFTPGTDVTKLRQDLFGATIVVEVGGYELALRDVQARAVNIQR